MTTKDTTPFHIWRFNVEHNITAKVKEGPAISTGDNHGDAVAEWLRVPAQSDRILRAYRAGETISMIADEMVLRWYGHRRALREDADRSPIGAAHRASMNVPLSRSRR